MLISWVAGDHSALLNSDNLPAMYGKWGGGYGGYGGYRGGGGYGGGYSHGRNYRRAPKKPTAGVSCSTTGHKYHLLALPLPHGAH